MPPLEKLMPVAAASWVLDMPKATIEQTIEEGSLPKSIVIKRGHRIYFAAKSLPYVKFSASTRSRFSKQYRTELLTKMVFKEQLVLLDAGSATKIDLKDYWREISDRFKKWIAAENAVTRDPEIMGGEPCLHGTRIPVYAVADMLAAGDSAEAILANYPSLTSGAVEMARIYAAANPKRGRPSKPSWRNKAPVKTVVISKRSIAG